MAAKSPNMKCSRIRLNTKSIFCPSATVCTRHTEQGAIVSAGQQRAPQLTRPSRAFFSVSANATSAAVCAVKARAPRMRWRGGSSSSCCVACAKITRLVADFDVKDGLGEECLTHLRLAKVCHRVRHAARVGTCALPRHQAPQAHAVNERVAPRPCARGDGAGCRTVRRALSGFACCVPASPAVSPRPCSTPSARSTTHRKARDLSARRQLGQPAAPGAPTRQ